MKIVSSRPSAVRLPRVSLSRRSRAQRAGMRSERGATYRHLCAAYDHYALDVPADSFPTFLESLFLERIEEAGDRDGAAAVPRMR